MNLMVELTADLSVTPWRDLDGSLIEGRVERIGIMPSATQDKGAAVLVLVRLNDGTPVLGSVSLRTVRQAVALFAHSSIVEGES